MDKFWSSNRNKVLFQQFAEEILMDLGRSQKITVVASGVVDDVSVPVAIYQSDEKTHSLIPELQLDYEETDWRIIPHLLSYGISRIFKHQNVQL